MNLSLLHLFTCQWFEVIFSQACTDMVNFSKIYRITVGIGNGIAVEIEGDIFTNKKGASFTLDIFCQHIRGSFLAISSRPVYTLNTFRQNFMRPCYILAIDIGAKKRSKNWQGEEYRFWLLLYYCSILPEQLFDFFKAPPLGLRYEFPEKDGSNEANGGKGEKAGSHAE